MSSRTKSGAALSIKQLAHSVKDGRQVRFHLTTGDEIIGYVCGMDDYHWMVVTSSGTKHLLHKAGVVLLDLLPDPTLDQEPEQEALERVIGHFRAYIMEHHFKQPMVAREDQVERQRVG
jgi:hypothetical protein